MYPKQLLRLNGELTLLQQTALRLEGMPNLAEECLVVCNESHRFLVAEQLREIGVPARIVLEPEGRNTAPAVALAALLAAETAPDGIVPNRPETGYGYIQATPRGSSVVPVRSFVEKPDKKAAEAYIEDGEHFWNSGMFLFSARSYLDNLSRFAPKIYEFCAKSIKNREKSSDFVRPEVVAFGQCPSDSVDYAVMEKTADAVMLPLDAGWSDIGSWAALHDVLPQDAEGNRADGDVLLHDCRRTFVMAGSRMVAAVGLDDIVVVETKDATLVTSRANSQDVKFLVDQLKATNREEVRLHRQVFRPWGSYDGVDSDDGFQVKRLIVNPGAVLSLQKHARRAEHWVVVRGKARITRNDEVFDLGVNESTYIAIGDVHRIANPFDEPVHIIEVQCGDYLGEDDIVRIEDEYGREGTNT
jgi:mannose-1-phosphate guanylyltransferase/mannose-6-phosphate isomerase